jgi:hypothetical protein
MVLINIESLNFVESYFSYAKCSTYCQFEIGDRKEIIIKPLPEHDPGSGLLFLVDLVVFGISCIERSRSISGNLYNTICSFRISA